MKRSAWLVSLLATSALVASAGAAPQARVLRTATPVEGLAADGATVAVSTAFATGHCERTVAWNPVRPLLRGLGTTAPCPATSTGRSILFQAVAGSRVAWVRDGGGNQRESELFIASLERPQVARRVVLARRDTDSGGGDYVGHVRGDGTLLVYSTWSACDTGEAAFRPCLAGMTPATPYNARLWRLEGTSGRKTLLASAPDELAPLGVSAGRILVQRGDGALEVRRANGEVLQTFSFPRGAVRQAVLGPSDLVVVLGPTTVPPLEAKLDLLTYDPISGARKRTLSAPEGAPIMAPRCTYPVGSSPAACRLPHARFRLEDVEAHRFVFVLDTTVHVVSLARRVEQRFGTIGRPPVFAQLEAPGLVYSYRMTTRLKGRVQFIPARELR